MNFGKNIFASMIIGFSALTAQAANVSQDNAQIHAKVQQIFATLDSIDPNKTAEMYSDDSVLFYANSPALVGKKAIFEMQKGFFSSIKGMKHTIKRVWESNGTVAVEMTVTYHRLDDSYVTLPVTDIMTLKDGKITETAVYMDSAPLFEKTPAK